MRLPAPASAVPASAPVLPSRLLTLTPTAIPGRLVSVRQARLFEQLSAQVAQRLDCVRRDS